MSRQPEEKDAPLEDPEIERLWTIAILAKAWGVTPIQMARELDEDPEMLSATCYTLLQYAEAKAEYDSADKGRIEACRKANPNLFAIVEQNGFALAGEDV